MQHDHYRSLAQMRTALLTFAVFYRAFNVLHPQDTESAYIFRALLELYRVYSYRLFTIASQDVMQPHLVAHFKALRKQLDTGQITTEQQDENLALYCVDPSLTESAPSRAEHQLID